VYVSVERPPSIGGVFWNQGPLQTYGCCWSGYSAQAMESSIGLSVSFWYDSYTSYSLSSLSAEPSTNFSINGEEGADLLGGIVEPPVDGILESTSILGDGS